MIILLHQICSFVSFSLEKYKCLCVCVCEREEKVQREGRKSGNLPMQVEKDTNENIYLYFRQKYIARYSFNR